MRTFLTLLALVGLSLSAAASETFPVSALKLDMDQDYGGPHRDRSVDANPLSIGGQKFQHGIGTHANSVLYIRLNGKAEQFTSFVGVDDEVGTRGTVTFSVRGDDRVLWESGVMRGGNAPQFVSVDLRGIKTLVLAVGDGGDGIDSDHADWAECRVVMAEGAPETFVPAAPTEPAIVLTPPPGPEPRIHGTRLVGARPGAPFLLRIAATGQRPITYSATGLPKGLKLAADGIISGAIRKKGEWTVTMRAKNVFGQAERKVDIRCGDQIGLTPAMGWNSWNCFASEVTAERVKAAATAMVSSGLADHGWSYINIDDFWQVHRNSKDPTLQGPKRDAKGRILPNPRFPDMKGLAEFVHSRGLRIGLYSSPGPWTCGGCVGSWQHEDQDARQYADWGFDYLKYDWCSYSQEVPGNWSTYSRETLQKPYRVMRAALDKVHRDILYSLCQYGSGNVWEWGAQVGGNSWRTTGDIVDSWSSMSRIGFGQAGHEKFAGPGHFNDPDMLVVGKVGWGPQLHPTRLTPNEQFTHISLWCLLSAPLLIGCDMTQLDPFTLGLLTNDEVIDVDQDPLGRQAAPVSRTGQFEVWAKILEDGSKAVGLFNRGEAETEVAAKWSDLGISGRQIVRDLWRQLDVGTYDTEFKTRVPRHGVVLVRVRPAN